MKADYVIAELIFNPSLLCNQFSSLLIQEGISQPNATSKHSFLSLKDFLCQQQPRRQEFIYLLINFFFLFVRCNINTPCYHVQRVPASLSSNYPFTLKNSQLIMVTRFAFHENITLDLSFQTVRSSVVARVQVHNDLTAELFSCISLQFWSLIFKFEFNEKFTWKFIQNRFPTSIINTQIILR